MATAQFLVGRMTEAECFSVPPAVIMNVPGRKKQLPEGTRTCEVLFYAGVKRLVDGDRKTAAQYFKESMIAPGGSSLIEGELAKAQLRLMRQP
jgi:hypothetical protein